MVCLTRFGLSFSVSLDPEGKVQTSCPVEAAAVDASSAAAATAAATAWRSPSAATDAAASHAVEVPVSRRRSLFGSVGPEKKSHWNSHLKSRIT